VTCYSERAFPTGPDPSVVAVLFPSRLRASRIGLVLLTALIAVSSGISRTIVTAASDLQVLDRSEKNFYKNVHPYLEAPLEQLVVYIPELETLQPARDQQALPMILERTGANVDDFFRDIINLVAHEEVTEEKVGKKKIQATRQMQYNYLILFHRDEKPPRFEEYRADSVGKPATQKDATEKYSVTSGFTLKCIYFSTKHMSESIFRYLGDEVVGARNTYVVAFAQQPARATISEYVSGNWGSVTVHEQGVAWIDKSSFQIIRLRTDILAPPTDMGLDRQTTEVTFSEFRLPEIEKPIWLPSKVQVDAVFDGQAFRNEHLYTNYKHFHVSVNIKP
jgi:hypothetical protein